MVGGITLGILLDSVDRYAARQRNQNVALAHRLKAFEYSARVRQAAAVTRESYEINMLAHRAYQAMLRAAIEADCKAASAPAKKHRC